VRNPFLTENYRTMEGQRVTLEEMIVEEIKELAFIYIETTGKKPTPDMMESWLERLRKAYHERKVTKIQRR
jgi:hypothetical protein